jgi:hypothetical protein
MVLSCKRQLMLSEIGSLSEELKVAKSHSQKNLILDRFLGDKTPPTGHLDPARASCLKQLIAIQQMPKRENQEGSPLELLDQLLLVDDFYRELGGLVGYQVAVLSILQGKAVSENERGSSVHFLSPSFIDISKLTREVEETLEEGTSAMPFACEMYPLGGAADRLHLVDRESGEELPAAKLEFAGKTLLKRLLLDLEAREYRYFQKTGEVLTTPVVIMTSKEKNNWIHVQNILEENQWFGRPKDSFRMFVQPLVPVVDDQGDWCWIGSWKLSLKPGGHGAIWKLARDNQVFHWLKSLGKRYALIRQINNPLAGIDYGLLALLGIGANKKMSFGFASCPRLCQAAEGMNVLIERQKGEKYSYVLSNIEYSEFAKVGIKDEPLVPNQPYSRFTSNTNILFAHLAALEEAVKECPFPGLLLNFKKDAKGRSFGRLESTMQNIADVFVEERGEPLGASQLKHTFVTYNERHKTISTAKKAYTPGCLPNETPEKCFYDLMGAHRELLTDFCHFQLPAESQLDDPPSFVFLYHPALGPLFKTIGEKIERGSFSLGSEFILEMADANILDLEIDGSIQIVSKEPLGKHFSTPVPQCKLSRVRVINRGVDWEHSKPYWRGRPSRWESLFISLEGRSEFIAEDVSFKGDLQFTVRDGERMRVRQGKGDSLVITSESL